MTKISTKIVAAVFAAFFSLSFLGCQSGVGEEATKTPIGSVINGDTRNSAEYFQRVREGNTGKSSESWKPESPDRM